MQIHNPRVSKEPGDFTHLLYAKTIMEADQEPNNDSLAKYVYCAPAEVAVAEEPEDSYELRIADNVVHYTLPEGETATRKIILTR